MRRNLKQIKHRIHEGTVLTDELLKEIRSRKLNKPKRYSDAQ